MRSIDNLREWWRDRFPVMDRQLGCDFREHIDAIEREVKELADERDLLKRQWEAGVDFDQRLAAAAEGRADVTLFGVDYTALPVDADGEYIHVGDVVTAKLLFGGTSEPLVVDRMELSRGKDGYLWMIALDTDKSCFNLPGILRHHHAPTVEDVLEEFVARWMETHHDDVPALKAEYAARLRLAGEE